MTAARPLRDVFTELTGDEEARRAHAADPQGFLSAQGHPDLSTDLVAEAVVSYADTAPPEVAEHLAPYVIEHSPVPRDGDVDMEPATAAPESWFDLMATAPAAEEFLPGPDAGLAPDDSGALDPDHPADSASLDLEFGRGAAAEAGIAAVDAGDPDEYAATGPHPGLAHDVPRPGVDDLPDPSHLDHLTAAGVLHDGDPDGDAADVDDEGPDL